MKKLFISLFVSIVVLTAGASVAAAGPRKIVDAQTIAATGTYTSSVIKLLNTDGYFSLQVEVTGDGTVKFEYLLSNNETDFLMPTSAIAIATGVVKTSGPGSDGKDIYSFHPPLARELKILVTETGGANSVVVSAWLAAK